MDLNLFGRKLRTAVRLAWHDPSYFLAKTGLARVPKSLSAAGARRYLASTGMDKLLVQGDQSEFRVSDDKAVDLRNLHRLVMRLRPANVVEFGCGFSTLAMLHAFSLNAERHGMMGKLHVLESDEKWADNLRKKIPASLCQFVDLQVQAAELIQIGGQLCHAFPVLPNVRPEMMYIDGPDVRTVKGSAHGLSFGPRTALPFACSADPLLYEWGLYPGAVILLDGRVTNVDFLRKNLKRKYRVTTHLIHDFTTFSLLR